ncbi:LuxR C-terminal-related transcriptional regulator [Tengunoibacter tsumagoiensis]|uniref:DNA-binding response regulator n=1 Tax=Tengunoibacter tsumagoiensis TaxID=2014871 RepID=A0A402A5X9_9CHLR|nr:LuxR C-terminal-related transcriptional regulator [Tengunoibacter tsumagoiensis]GCE14520.1 DNA-binding response regulator [Tengunoibacter tsumagoiensis]
MGLLLLIIEPNDIVRAGLRSIFENDPSVSAVYEASMLRDSVEKDAHTVNLIIINQSVMTERLSIYREKCVVIANNPNLADLKTAYDTGALGYLTPHASRDLLRSSLHISKQSFLIEPTLTPLLMRCIFDSKNSYYIKDELLTPREREIVTLLRSGIDRVSIAKHLHIANTTLKTHIKNIARKREQIEQTAQLQVSH